MRRTIQTALSMLGVCAFCASSALAQDLVVYPAKGQSAEQTRRDKGECHVWAVEETGFDPASATPPPQTVTTQLEKERVVGSGAAVRGAAGGAAVGAVTGAIIGDAGKGAAAGAAGGALIGTMRRHREVKNAPTSESHTNPEWTQYQAQRDRYHKAVKACLSGRGYGVE